MWRGEGSSGCRRAFLEGHGQEGLALRRSWVRAGSKGELLGSAVKPFAVTAYGSISMHVSAGLQQPGAGHPDGQHSRGFGAGHALGVERDDAGGHLQLVISEVLVLRLVPPCAGEPMQIWKVVQVLRTIFLRCLFCWNNTQ